MNVRLKPAVFPEQHCTTINGAGCFKKKGFFDVFCKFRKVQHRRVYKVMCTKVCSPGVSILLSCVWPWPLTSRNQARSVSLGGRWVLLKDAPTQPVSAGRRWADPAAVFTPSSLLPARCSRGFNTLHGYRAEPRPPAATRAEFYGVSLSPKSVQSWNKRTSRLIEDMCGRAAGLKLKLTSR